MNVTQGTAEVADVRGLTMSHWPADHSSEILDTTLGDLLRQVASEVPDRTFLVEVMPGQAERRRWTYGEFLRDAEKLARGLLHYFKPGERVAVYGTNSAEWVMLQHGLSFAGLLLVPVNPAYTPREVAFLLRDSEAAGLFYDENFRGQPLVQKVEEIQTHDLPALREIRAVAELSVIMDAADPDRALPQVSPGDPLQIQYTSGTTGKPKGALLHHRGVINTARGIALRARFPDGGVHVNAMPMFHIAGAAVTEMGVIALRGTFVLLSHWDAEMMMEAIQSEGGNATLIVPTMILGILDHPDRDKYELSSLQTILSGAANVPAAMVQRVHRELGCKVCVMFGQTESNGPIAIISPDDSLTDQSETVGRPLPRVEVRIVNVETLETVPVDEVGEIWIRGYQTMPGYFNLPEQSAATIRPDGWLRTGDLGSMDERGYLKITGRLKEMIIRGGMHLYPKEIEDVLFEHPAVDQIAVLGLPDEKWGEVVAAVISRAPGQSAAVQELDAYCRANLSRQKIPSLWFFVEEWPLTPSGKIQKHVLADMIADGRLTPTKE